jgi:hypothetical protein
MDKETRRNRKTAVLRIFFRDPAFAAFHIFRSGEVTSSFPNGAITSANEIGENRSATGLYEESPCMSREFRNLFRNLRSIPPLPITPAGLETTPARRFPVE